MQLEDLVIPQRPENLQILEISDKFITIKPKTTSTQNEFVDSTMTSLWKIDCKTQI